MSADPDATDTDARAFLDAIAANPADDTARLVFADYLDENGDPARAEFIRVGIELTGYRSDGWDGDPEKCRVAWLERRVEQLRTAHEAEWRKGPVCENCNGFGFTKESCGGPGSEQVPCLNCKRTGDAGGLMRKIGGGSVDITAGRLAGGWYHPGTFARGFPDEVRCELGEVIESGTVCPRCMAAQLYSDAECRYCGCETRRTLAMASWARRVVRYHPVRGFRVTDREPLYGGADEYSWMRGMDNTANNRLPEPVWDAMVGGRLAGLSWKVFPTPEAAHDALASALARLARKANATLEEART